MRNLMSICLVLLGLFKSVTVNAVSEWDKSESMAFMESAEYKVVLDVKDIHYAGLDSLQFLDYAANMNKTTPEKIGATLRFLSYEVSNFVETKTKSRYSIKAESPAEIIIKIIDINYKAGMEAEVYVRYNGKESTQKKKIKIKDGRWNTFEELVQENSKKLAEKVVSYIEGLRREILWEKIEDESL